MWDQSPEDHEARTRRVERATRPGSNLVLPVDTTKSGIEDRSLPSDRAEGSNVCFQGVDAGVRWVWSTIVWSWIGLVWLGAAVAAFPKSGSGYENIGRGISVSQLQGGDWGSAVEDAREKEDKEDRERLHRGLAG